MKKILRALLTVLSVSIGIPLASIVCIGYLLFVPFDIIRYHRMPYYQDFKKKYQFFVTSSDIVRFYNRITKERLPIAYFNHNDFEYFVEDDQVLLCGWSYDGFEQIDGQWFFILDGECDTTMSMGEILENEKELLLPEHQHLDAKFLIFYSDITDADQFEQAKSCPYFHCIFSSDEDL